MAVMTEMQASITTTIAAVPRNIVLKKALSCSAATASSTTS